MPVSMRAKPKSDEQAAAFVADWVAAGRSQVDCLRRMEARWGYDTDRGLAVYVAACQRLQLLMAPLDRETYLARLFHQQEHLLQQAIEDGDTRTAAALVRDLSALTRTGGPHL